jgi:hypothetical protein
MDELQISQRFMQNVKTNKYDAKYLSKLIKTTILKRNSCAIKFPKLEALAMHISSKLKSLNEDLEIKLEPSTLYMNTMYKSMRTVKDTNEDELMLILLNIVAFEFISSRVKKCNTVQTSGFSENQLECDFSTELSVNSGVSSYGI